MKHRNQFLKYKLHMQMSPDGGGGGGGDAGGAANSGGDSDGNSGGQQQSGNNGNSNLISHDNLWETNTNAGGNGNANTGQQPAQQQPAQRSASEQFQAHIDSLDFMGSVNPTEVMTALQNGDADAFGKALTSIGVQAYRNAMTDANKVVQQRVDKMSTTIKSDMSAQNATGELVREMNSQLPFTKSPAYAPVANLVLTQFLQKGMKQADAIKEVGKYFSGLSGEVGKLSSGAPSGRPAGNFGGNLNGGDAGNQGGGEPDWFDFLGAPQT